MLILLLSIYIPPELGIDHISIAQFIRSHFPTVAIKGLLLLWIPHSVWNISNLRYDRIENFVMPCIGGWYIQSETL